MHMGKLLRSVRYVTRVQNILENIERVLRVAEHPTAYRTELFWMGIKRCSVSHAITKHFLFVIDAANSVKLILLMKMAIPYVIYVPLKVREFVPSVGQAFLRAKEGYVLIVGIKIVIVADYLLGATHCQYICPNCLLDLENGLRNEEVFNMRL